MTKEMHTAEMMCAKEYSMWPISWTSENIANRRADTAHGLGIT